MIKKCLRYFPNKVMGIILSVKYYGNLSNGSNAKLLHNDFKKVIRLKNKALSQGLKLIDGYVDTKKKSDTIFILGSGESINYLTEENWNEIKKHNTLGFNYYFAHDFAPDYYMIELNKWPEMHRYFEDTVKIKYKDIDMFIQYEHALIAEYDFTQYPYPKKLWVHIPYRLPSKSKINLQETIDYLQSKKTISLANLVHHSSHTDCAILLAYALGYKKIVLLGVDLNGSSYFTSKDAHVSEVYPFNSEYERMNLIRDEYTKSCGEFYMKNHPTMIKEHVEKYNAITLEDSIDVINKTLLKPNNATLFVGHSSSALAEAHPVYFKKRNNDFFD